MSHEDEHEARNRETARRLEEHLERDEVERQQLIATLDTLMAIVLLAQEREKTRVMTQIGRTIPFSPPRRVQNRGAA